MQRSPVPKPLALVTGLALLLTSAALPAPAQAEGLPPLIITEIVPATSGASQAYEYVEVYNPGAQPVSLDNYKLLYYTASPYQSPANRWTITAKVVPPKGSLVLWLKKYDNPNVPLADFNQNYGVGLSADQVFEVRLTTSAQGLHDSAKRRVAIATPAETVISGAYINDGVADGTGKANLSVTYRYVGALDMARITGGQPATPGTVLAQQDPLVPAGLAAETGNGSVSLTWTSLAQWGVTAYNVYQDGVKVGQAGPDAAVEVTGLQNGVAYTFAVSSVDVAGYESPLSAAVTVTPTADLTPPAAPTGLAAESLASGAALQWAPNTEKDLAGYRIYLDGALAAETGATSYTLTGLNARQAYAAQVSAVDRTGNESERSSPVTVTPTLGALPPLLITELLADSDNHYAGFDAYEFVEVHNASQDPVDLQGYTIRLDSSNRYWEKRIDRSAVVRPGETAVLWTRRGELAAMETEAFNLYYFSSYPTRFVPEPLLVPVDDVSGLINTDPQSAVLISPTGQEVVSASYNDAAKEVALDKSVTYAYPLDGSKRMRKVQAGSSPTPGALEPRQAPPADPADTQAPAAPAGLTATAGAGSVALGWAPVHEPDLAGYTIYRDGQPELRVPAGQTSSEVYLLTGGVSYSFTVTATDSSGNESAPSLPAAATPAHQEITQQQVGSGQHGDRYPAFWNISSAGPVIPGLAQDLVPQAVAYWPGQNWLITSNYLEDGRPSVLTVVDASSQSLVKSIRLYQEDGTVYKGHAGGIAVSGQHLWVASGGYVYYIPLQSLLEAPGSGELRFAGRFQVATNASFATYADGVLWVGEFYHPPTYQTNPTHALTNNVGGAYYAWVAGYRLDPSSDLPVVADATPDYVLSIPNRIQGMAVTADSVVLSQSFGRNVDSTLYRYARPGLDQAPHTWVTAGGRSVPVWFLDGANQAPNYGALTLPPLSEGLAAHGDSLYVLFESGAAEYRHTTPAQLDRLRLVSMEHWTRYETLAITGLPPVLEVGHSARFRVVQYLGNLPQADLTSAVGVAASDPAVAAVSPDGTVAGLAPGPVTITANYQGRTASVTLNVATLEAVRLSGAPDTLPVGQTAQLTVEAIFSDGTILDVTDQAAFTDTHGGSVSIAPGGLLMAAKPGDVRVEATYHGLTSGETRLIVRPK